MSKVLDARVQQIERLMSQTICKQQKMAEEDPNEALYKKDFEKYKLAIDAIEDTLFDYENLITIRLIRDYLPITKEEAQYLLSNLHDLRQELKAVNKYNEFMNVLRNDVIDSYVEYNPYYRMLMGVPPYDEKEEDYIIVNGTPIHELDYGQVLELKRLGKLDTLIADNPDKKYLRFIDKDIDLIYARTAPEYAILWTPKKREFNIYREMYNNERKEWMRTYHNEYANYASDFNETFELTILKLRAIITFYIHSYSNLLNKSTYTKEESEDIFQSFGLNFPSDMPDSYRDSLTFVLNYLNISKGTNYAIKFITKKLFAGLRLFKYWIRKRKNNITSLNTEFPTDADGVLLPPKNIKYEDNSEVYSKEEIEKARQDKKAQDPTAQVGDMEMDTTASDVYLVDFILRPINSTNIIDFSTYDGSDALGRSKKIVNKGSRARYLINHARSILSDEDINKALASVGVDHKDIILTYDDIVKLDPRWSDEETLKEQVHKEEFSYVESKYIGIDNIVNIQDFTVSIGIIHRYFVKKKKLLDSVSFNYPGTGANHSFFNLWMYYMTLTNYGFLKTFNMPIGDTVLKPRNFYGFNTIKTNPTIRLYWLIVFAQYNIDVTLEEFPDPLNDNDTFVRLMQHVERSIGLAKFTDSVITQARTHVEVDMILDLQKHVRYVTKEPDKFDAGPNENKPFMEYLSENDGQLAFLADDIINRGPADLSMEMDNIANFLIEILIDLENDRNGDFPDMRESLFQTNMMYGGLSQHLLHVIRLFKAWSVEFIGEKSALIITSEDSDPLIMVDQMTPNYNITQKYRWNITQDHWLDFNGDDETVWDDVLIEDACYLVTRYGDILIS